MDKAGLSRNGDSHSPEHSGAEDLLDLIGDAPDPELSSAAIRKLLAEAAALAAGRIAAPPVQTRRTVERKLLEGMLPPSPPQQGEGPEELLCLLSGVLLPNCREYRHRGHYGHQRPSPMAASLAADLLVQAANPSVTMYEGGLMAVVAEQRVLQWLRQILDLPTAFVGSMVSGGAEATLTALLCARERALQRRSGAAALLRVYASELAHYSVERAVHILGLAPDAFVPIRCDQEGRIDPKRLRDALAIDQARGLVPAAVVASAGTTALGSYDDLIACREASASAGAWLHVDAAHGGAAALCGELRHLLSGIVEADSVVWNPHKLLWVAPPCSVLFVQPADALRRALAPGVERASYVMAEPSGDEPLRWTVACTRYAAAFRILAVLVCYGLAGMADRVRRAALLTRHLHRLIARDGELCAAAAPALNIVCFRFQPAGLQSAQSDALQDAIRDCLAQGPDAYLTGVELGGRRWLRAQLMSDRITPQSNHELLQLVKDTGWRILKQGREEGR